MNRTAEMEQKQSKAQRTLARILDAALQCYQEHGIAHTTLEHVARTSGLSRTTLYRYVDNRDDLLNKVVLRDARQQQAEMLALTRYHTDFAQGVVDTFIYVMRGRRTRPINTLLFGSADDSIADRVNLSPASFFAITQPMLAPLFERALAAGQIRDGVTLEQASQWVARVMLSLVNYPEEFLHDEEGLRKFLEAFLVPSLVKDPNAGGASQNTATHTSISLKAV